jgi:mono/diheme cytochrome c family protein
VKKAYFTCSRIFSSVLRPAQSEGLPGPLPPGKMRFTAALARACFVIAFAAAILFALQAAQAEPPRTASQSAATPAGNAQKGKKIFVSDGCYECHGREGQGATQTGAPRIGPPPVPFGVFESFVRKPINNMPPYTKKVVSDQDLADIYAFLKSIPMPPKGKDIPLLNQ